MKRLPQDFDPTAIARIYYHQLEKMDLETRTQVIETAEQNPGLYLRDLGDDRLELYLIADETEVSVGAFPRRWLMLEAIQTDS